MATKSKRRKTVKKVVAVATNRTKERKLIGGQIHELRGNLNMPRDVFGRMINTSVRTLAEVESGRKTNLGKLDRNYTQVERLCHALGEVVDSACLGDWFKTPNDAFDGFKPMEIIERGEIDRLWEMIYRLKSGMPG